MYTNEWLSSCTPVLVNSQESASECFLQSSQWRPWWSSSAWAAQSYWTASWSGLRLTSSPRAFSLSHRAGALWPHSQWARTSSNTQQSRPVVSSSQTWNQRRQVSVRPPANRAHLPPSHWSWIQTAGLLKPHPGADPYWAPVILTDNLDHVQVEVILS